MASNAYFLDSFSKDIPWQNIFKSEYSSQYFNLSLSERNKELINILPDNFIKGIQFPKEGAWTYEAPLTDEDRLFWQKFVKEVNEATWKGGKLSVDEEFHKKAFAIINAEMQIFGFKLLTQATFPLNEKKKFLEDMRLGNRPNYALSMFGEIVASRIAQNAHLIRGSIFSEMVENHGLFEAIVFIQKLSTDPQLQKWAQIFYPILLGIT